MCISVPFAARTSDAPNGVELDLRPRVCTMAAGDKQCRAQVLVSWRSAPPRALCLTVADRPELNHCWDAASEGNITVEVRAAADVAFQLQTADRPPVVASNVLRVVRESIQYRPRRRAPWSLFE